MARGKQNPRASGKADVELGTRIRLRRVEMNVSQGELGQRLGISFQQVQKYEKGVNRLSANRLEQIAEALDVPMAFFFGGTAKARDFETLLFNDSTFALRLLKAYNAMNADVARRFVTLAEAVAQDASAAE